MSGLVPGITKSQKFNYLLFWLENVWISLKKKKNGELGSRNKGERGDEDGPVQKA